MKTRDPDDPGAHKLSPIEPGTLCLVVLGRVHPAPKSVGRIVTVLAQLHGECPCGCGEQVYLVTAPIGDGINRAARSSLQPILPPGIDDQVERAIGNPQLEVV